MRMWLGIAVACSLVVGACTAGAPPESSSSVPSTIPAAVPIRVFENLDPGERYLIRMALSANTSRGGWYQRSTEGPIARWVLPADDYTLSIESIPCSVCELSGPEHTNGTLLDTISNSCLVEFTVAGDPVTITFGEGCSVDVEGAVIQRTAGQPSPPTTSPPIAVADMRAVWASRGFDPYTIDYEQLWGSMPGQDDANGFISITAEDGAVRACSYAPFRTTDQSLTSVCDRLRGTAGTPIEWFFDLIERHDPDHVTVVYGDDTGIPWSIVIDDPGAVDDGLSISVLRFVGSEPDA